jgi:Mg2+-importing ATPase
MTDQQLRRAVETTSVFAKVDPLQKAIIIKALRANGHTVGYMGDGVNDAAAMHQSDVGISVDGGVDIAKEAADLVLLKHDLMVLVDGVVQGRTVFGNIMKYIKMTVSSNFGNMLSVLVASALLPFLPMLPIHLLVQNLIYDISQFSLPWDGMDPEFLAHPREWDATGIAQFMLSIGPVSSLFDIATFAVMWFVFQAQTPASMGLFQTGWFVEGLLSQTFIVYMIRTQRIPFIQSLPSKPVLVLTAAAAAVGVALPFTIAGAAIGLRPLPLSYFGWLLAILIGYAATAQLAKHWYIGHFKRWL